MEVLAWLKDKSIKSLDNLVTRSCKVLVYALLDSNEKQDNNVLREKKW